MISANFLENIKDLSRTDSLSGLNTNDMIFLYNFIKQHKFTNVLEIGMAGGMSSIAILSALAETSLNFKLTSIDPYQSTQWISNGLKNIIKCNFSSNHELIELSDMIALPKLLEKGEKYDLIFIDGMHTFDHVLLNNFYADKLLNIGGFIINDDIWMPSIQRVCNYLTKNYTHFQIIDDKYYRFGPIYKKINNNNIEWNEFTDF